MLKLTTIVLYLILKLYEMTHFFVVVSFGSDGFEVFFLWNLEFIKLKKNMKGLNII